MDFNIYNDPAGPGGACLGRRGLGGSPATESPLDDGGIKAGNI